MLRLLLVEDNRVFREAFKQSLSEHFPSGLIDEAENADEALRKVNVVSPHLIFMDIRLPGMNGLQLTKKIKKEFPGTHVAIMTGYDLPEYKEGAMQYGADRFFVKDSLDWDEIKVFIKTVDDR